MTHSCRAAASCKIRQSCLTLLLLPLLLLLLLPLLLPHPSPRRRRRRRRARSNRQLCQLASWHPAVQVQRWTARLPWPTRLVHVLACRTHCCDSVGCADDEQMGHCDGRRVLRHGRKRTAWPWCMRGESSAKWQVLENPSDAFLFPRAHPTDNLLVRPCDRATVRPYAHPGI